MFFFLVVAAVVHHAALSVSCVVLLSCSCFVCAYVCLECFAFLFALCSDFFLVMVAFF